MELGGKMAMSDTSTQDFFTRQAHDARGPEEPKRRPTRRRRLKRIAIAAGASLGLMIGAVAGAGYLYVSHLASSIHRIPNIVALTAAHRPAGEPGVTNVLLTDSGVVPDRNTATGLIEILHLNPGHHRGAVVSIPADVVVHVPGHGRMKIGDTLALGGPSLLIETVQDVTDVRIDHYSVVDFGGLAQVVGAMNGVDVRVPFTTTSDGFTFPAGINDLNSADALAYARQPAVSEIGREQLQENLIRAIMDKIANQGLFDNPKNLSVLQAVTGAVSVDSNLSNSQLMDLGLDLGDLRSRNGTFVDAPVLHGSPTSGGDRPVFFNTRLAGQLWMALRDDRVAAFARRYPFTVTPGAPA